MLGKKGGGGVGVGGEGAMGRVCVGGGVGGGWGVSVYILADYIAVYEDSQ